MKKQLSTETESAMDRMVKGLTTKSDKIRELAAANYPRADIARYLKIRYQHVRNVLVNDEKKRREMRQTEKNDSAPPQQVWARVDPDGRVVIPEVYHSILGIKGGGPVMLRLEGDEVHLIGRDTAIRRIQDMVAKYVPEGVSLVDELLAERRREVEREERKEREMREGGRRQKRA